MSECPLVAHRMSGRGGCPGAFRELFGREETLSLVLLSFSVWGGGGGVLEKPHGAWFLPTRDFVFFTCVMLVHFLPPPPGAMAPSFLVTAS